MKDTRKTIQDQLRAAQDHQLLVKSYEHALNGSGCLTGTNPLNTSRACQIYSNDREEEMSPLCTDIVWADVRMKTDHAWLVQSTCIQKKLKLH